MNTQNHIPRTDVTSAETSDVMRAVLSVPQVSLNRSWKLSRSDDRWSVLAEGADVSGEQLQPRLVGCGAAVEHVVVALQARGLRVAVELLPTADPTADPATVATVVAIGPGPSNAVDHALRAACELPPVRPPGPALIGPSDLRSLNLTLEAFAVEALWSSDLATRRELTGLQRVRSSPAPRPMVTLVTPDDTPHDWLQAGRALAHLLLRTTSLGLVGHLDVHALRQRDTRDAVRSAWDLQQYPQVQVSIGPSSAAQRDDA
jgi:hypothetical protein